MSESQKHGFIFEDWIKENKLNEIYKLMNEGIVYTNDWDIPPVSIKSFKFNKENSSIDFGSIERIFTNQSSYILVLIGYEQTDDIKKPVFSEALYIQLPHMKKLKGTLDLETIKSFSDKVRSFQEGEHIEARIWAREEKLKHNHKTTYDIRFKIDSKKQRRVQCALRLKDIYSCLNKPFIKENKLGIPEIKSGIRKRYT